MVTDKKGNIFEDRRKVDRRKNEFDKTGGRRKEGRRETDKIKNEPNKK